MKDLKTRLKTLENTKKITKAMELVAASKLRGAQERALSSRPYWETLYQTLHEIADEASPFTRQTGGGKTCYVVIAGDRGLAGGYNHHVLKLARELRTEGDLVLPMGKKAAEFFRRQEISVETFAQCRELGQRLCQGYLAGEYDRVVLCYTRFVSVLTQTPGSWTLLPLPGQRRNILYEPDSVTALHTVVPESLGGLIFGALQESRCAEQAARRMAMDAATRNAEELIEKLGLQYNRARQSAITQELTELVAGAEF